MPRYCAGEHAPFDVRAKTHELGRGIPVGDSNDVLFNDRPFVEILGDVVCRGPNQFHSTFLGLLIWACTNERWQERVVDVDHWRSHRFKEVFRNDLHVAGQDNEIDIAAQQLQMPTFSNLLVVRDGT